MIGPGFGQRGIDGKFVAIKYTRTHDIPTFGICLGMQCIAIEFARNVLGYADADSREMDEKDSAQRDRHHGGTESDHQYGRYDASGRLRMCFRKDQKHTLLTAKNIFRNVTAIAMSSTMTIRLNTKLPV